MDSSIRERNFFDYAFIQRLVDEHRREARDWSANLWCLLNLSLWYDRLDWSKPQERTLERSMSDQAITSEPAENTPLASIEQRAFGSSASGVALTFATRLLSRRSDRFERVVARWLGPEGLGALAVLTRPWHSHFKLAARDYLQRIHTLISRDRDRAPPVRPIQ